MDESDGLENRCGRKATVGSNPTSSAIVEDSILFAAFVTEHKRRRFEAAAQFGRAYAVVVRKRWFSRRAVLLHSEFSVLAAACLAAGWWQMTRALAGNGLSWFYSVEWPAFALLAIAGWWHLIHEDPEEYRARKQRPPEWDAPDSVRDPT